MRCRAAAVTLLVVALFVALGHVCVSLSHASERDHETTHGRDDALHAASCEVVPPTPAPEIAPIAVIAVVRQTHALVVSRAARAAVAAVPPTASPPLFVLHAALLI